MQLLCQREDDECLAEWRNSSSFIPRFQKATAEVISVFYHLAGGEARRAAGQTHEERLQSTLTTAFSRDSRAGSFPAAELSAAAPSTFIPAALNQFHVTVLMLLPSGTDLTPGGTPRVTQPNRRCNADREASLNAHLKEEKMVVREGSQSQQLHCCPNSPSQLCLCLRCPLTSSCHPKFKQRAPPSHATHPPAAHDFPQRPRLR